MITNMPLAFVPSGAYGNGGNSEPPRGFLGTGGNGKKCDDAINEFQKALQNDFAEQSDQSLKSARESLGYALDSCWDNKNLTRIIHARGLAHQQVNGRDLGIPSPSSEEQELRLTIPDFLSDGINAQEAVILGLGLGAVAVGGAIIAGVSLPSAAAVGFVTALGTVGLSPQLNQLLPADQRPPLEA